MDKTVANLTQALDGVSDGATVLIGGFGEAGAPHALIDALIDQGAKDLTVVNNNAGVGREGLARLLAERRVRKVICSYPRSRGSVVFEELYAKGEIELEVVPQGTLSERIRAGGAGIAGFFTPTAADTILAEGKETRAFDGRPHVLELPIKGDVALIKADRGDRWGNLTYRKTARNFNPTMAMAARLTVAQVREIVPLGSLDPEHVVTPGVFVHRVVAVGEA